MLDPAHDGKMAKHRAAHGGARPGAGRKPGYRKPDARRNMVNVRLSDAELMLALQLGEGNASEGIRRALLSC